MKASEVFTPANCAQVEAAIGKAEQRSSGEIRLYVEDRCKVDVMDRAAFIFEKLGMHATVQRNGVLVYMAVADQKFAIIGDVGINTKVPDGFWNSVKDLMLQHFKSGDTIGGLVAGIEAAGEKLATYFPLGHDDRNELSNSVVIG